MRCLSRRFHLVLLIAFFFLATSRSVFAAEHPSLFTVEGDRAALSSRVSSSQVVSAAYTALKTSKIGTLGETDGWPYDLIQKSFYSWLSGDSETRQQALGLYDKYTQGSSRYSFSKFYGDERKYYYWSSCVAMAVGYDYLYPYLSDSQKQNGKSILAEWGEGLYGFYRSDWSRSGHNFHMGSVACLGLIGLVLDSDNANSNLWVNSARDSLVTYAFNDAYNPSGDYVDGHVYQYYGTPAAIMFASAYEKKRGTYLLSGKAIEGMWDYATYALMVDGTYARYGDNSDTTMINGENFYIYKHLQNDSAKAKAWLWIWQKIRGFGVDQKDFMYFKEFDYIGIILWYPVGTSAADPKSVGLPLSKYFLSRTTSTSSPGGMASFRTGWEPASSVSFWLVNRYRWQNHQHYDPNHFVFSAYGQKILGNENMRNYKDPLRGKLSQQNAVMIDGSLANGDMPDSDFVSGSGSSLGKFSEKLNNDEVDLISSDARYPMSDISSQTSLWQPSENNVAPIVQSERTAMLVKNMAVAPYLVLLDEVQKDSVSHVYSWQAYLGQGYQGLTGEGTVASPLAYRVGEVGVTVVSLSNVNFSKKVTPGDGASRLDDRLQFIFSSAPKLRVITFILPKKPAGSDSWQITPVGSGQDWWAVKVHYGSASNLLVYNATGSSVEADGIKFLGKLLIASQSGSEWQKYIVFRGINLNVNNKDVLASASEVTSSGVIGATVSTGESGDETCPSGDIGNVNCDIEGLINAYDLAIFLGSWSPNGPVPTPQSGYHNADLNSDGKINAYDLSRILGNWSYR